MLLELKFSIGTLGLAAGTLCSALYGMNLKNYIEESDLGFATVSGICFVCTAFVCAYGLVKLRRVQRVRMWGEGGIPDRYATGLANHPYGIPSAPRGNWRSDSLDPIWSSLPGEGRAERLRRIRSRVSSQVPVPAAGVPAAKRSSTRPPREGDVKQEPQQQQRQREKPSKVRTPKPDDFEQCNREEPGPASSSSSGASEAAAASAGLGSAR